MALWPVTRDLIRRWPGVTFRIDCALVPFLVAHSPDLDRLERFDIRGCHGGDHLVSVGVDGTRSPCSFVSGPAIGWHEGVASAPCASCVYQRVCRGGCHAVARHLAGELLAPDPECPRVIEWTASAAP
jgi:MoaA/NifB/PqqE/SkfB family radical SAM enzyme